MSDGLTALSRSLHALRHLAVSALKTIRDPPQLPWVIAGYADEAVAVLARKAPAATLA